MKKLKITLRDRFSGCTDVRTKNYKSEYQRAVVVERTKNVKYVHEFCQKTQIRFDWEIVKIEKI